MPISVPIQRHAVNERLCAVNGIDDPAEGAVARPVGQLLAHHGVVGKGLGNAVADVLFRAAVGDSDRRIVALALHFQVIAAEIVERQLAGLAGDLQGQNQARGQIVGFGVHGSGEQERGARSRSKERGAKISKLLALSSLLPAPCFLRKTRAMPATARRRPIGYPQY